MYPPSVCVSLTLAFALYGRCLTVAAAVTEQLRIIEGRVINDDNMAYTFCQTDADCQSQPCPELPAACMKYGTPGVIQGNKKYSTPRTVAG
jgi:hypothetical protein